jgi:RNA binding exosome subunit
MVVAKTKPKVPDENPVHMEVDHQSAYVFQEELFRQEDVFRDERVSLNQSPQNTCFRVIRHAP